MCTLWTQIDPSPTADAGQLSLRSSLYVLTSVVAAVATLLLLMAASENAPLVRLLSLPVVVFVGGIFIHESAIPVLGTVFGIIYVRLIGSWETQAPVETLVENCLWIIVTLSVGLGTSVLVEYAFAYKNPTDRLQAERVRRYEALEHLFSLCARGVPTDELWVAAHRVTHLAGEGQVQMQALLAAMAEHGLSAGTLPPAMQIRIAMIAQLMDLSAAFGTPYVEHPNPSVRERCERPASICRHLRTGQSVAESDRLPLSVSTDDTPLSRVERGFREHLNMPEEVAHPDRRDLVYIPPQHMTVLDVSALEKPDALAFALKLSGAATLCYVFYNATAWPGISAIVITVMVAAVTGSAAITQRLALRLTGTVIGGLLLGIGSVALIFPDLESIASLSVLVAVLAFAFAWCGAGRQFGFLGNQLAFAYFTVAIPDSHPVVDLTPARDSFLGVVLGTLVMWVVFNQLWPTTTNTLMRRMLASVFRETASLLLLMDANEDHATRLIRARVLRYRLGKTVSEICEARGLAEYEFGAHRAKEIEQAGRIADVALATTSFFWGRMALLYGERDPVEPAPPEVVEARREAARELSVLAAALEGREVETTAVLVPALAAPSAAGPQDDQELRNVRTGSARIRDGALDVLRNGEGEPPGAVVLECCDERGDRQLVMPAQVLRGHIDSAAADADLTPRAKPRDPLLAARKASLREGWVGRSLSHHATELGRTESAVSVDVSNSDNPLLARLCERPGEGRAALRAG